MAPHTTLLLRASAPLIPGLARVGLVLTDEALQEWKDAASPAGAPPRQPPSATAAARVATLLASNPSTAGAAVPVPYGSTAVAVYCLKSHVGAVFKTVAASSRPAAGVAVGDVQSSVTLAPPPPPEASTALMAALAAGLAAHWIPADPPGEAGGSAAAFLDASPLATPDLLSCALCRLVRVAARPPADAALTLAVSAVRARRLRATAFETSSTPPDLDAARAALAGVRCAVLPDFAAVAVSGVWPRHEGDAALVAAWATALGAPSLPPPPFWVWVIPDDGRDDDGPGTPGALAVPPAALFEAPGLVELPPGARAGGGGAALLRRVADALAATPLAKLWGGSLRVVGVVRGGGGGGGGGAAAFAPASSLARAGGGAAAAAGWDAPPPIAVEALPDAAPLPGSDAARQHQRSAALAALLKEAGAGGGGGGSADAAQAERAAAAAAALAAATARPPPGGVPCLRVRVPYVLGGGGGGGRGGRGRGRGGAAGGRGPAAAKKPRVVVAGASAAPAAVAAGTTPAAKPVKPAKAAKAAPTAEESAAAVAKVRATFAAAVPGTEPKTTAAGLTIDELKAFLKSVGGAVSGKKEVLAGRVAAALAMEGGGA